MTYTRIVRYDKTDLVVVPIHTVATTYYSVRTYLGTMIRDYEYERIPYSASLILSL